MSSVTEIAAGVVRVPTGISNAYIVGTRDRWCLVDTGTAGYFRKIRGIAEQLFGSNSEPEGIFLTHGHFDHAGSAADLSDWWRVPVIAHSLEMPFLTGRSKYPPADPTVGGFMSQMIRLFPNKAYDLGDRVVELDPDDIPEMHGWQCLETPGHSPGHVSFYREADGVLLSGDAVITMNQDSFWGVVSKQPQVSRPPAYYTCDWEKAYSSVRRLAELEPAVLGAGHGEPMSGDDVAEQLWQLAEDFPAPRHGRYVAEPAVTDENGIVYLPPPAPDPVKQRLIVAGSVAAAATVTSVALKQRAGEGKSRRKLVPIVGSSAKKRDRIFTRRSA